MSSRYYFIRHFVALLSLFCASVLHLQAQFAPAVGIPGSDAVAAESGLIRSWATACQVTRGYRDIAVHDSGYATLGTALCAIGPARDNCVVSLGDGGSATLTFAASIYDGTGADFAVFENGFPAGAPGEAFLELAFVEVSTDGSRYVRFPATSHVQDTMQLWLDPMDCSLIHNLAGKYVFGYGTPFDLSELKDSSGINIDSINYIRIIDVVGSLDSRYGSRDSRGRMINDPYPTNFPSSGFDLDAVAAMHIHLANGITDQNTTLHSFYPNPVRDRLQFNLNSDAIIAISDLSGTLVHQTAISASSTIDLSGLASGMYLMHIYQSDFSFTTKLIKE